MAVTPGHRVRVLLEWYDPGWSAEVAEELRERVVAEAAACYSGAVVVAYVEANPPADEVEDWSPSCLGR